MKSHNEEVELNDIVLFKFEKSVKEEEWQYFVRYSIWKYCINADKSIKLDEENYLMLCIKTINLRSLDRNFINFVPVFFQPHRTCLLHTTVYALTTCYKMDFEPANLQALFELTDGFSPKMVDKLHFLFNRHLYHSIKLICFQIRRLLSQYRLKKESLYEDFIFSHMGTDNKMITAQLQNVENQNRTFRDAILQEKMVR